MKTFKCFSIFAMLILGFVFKGTAQIEKPVYIGLKGGLSIPNLSSSGQDQNIWNKNYTSRLGPYIGAFIEIPFARHFWFQPEINYASEGGKRDGIQPMTIPAQYLKAFQAAFQTSNDYVFADFNNVSRINYLQIPLLLKYHIPLTANRKIQLYVQAGPDISYLVSAKQIIKTNDLKVYMDEQGKTEIPPQAVHQFFGSSLDTSIDAKSDLHHFNVGIQGAVGFSMALGRGKIFVEGGGNYGFIPIQKGPEHGKDHIGAGVLLLGYAMKLNKQ